MLRKLKEFDNMKEELNEKLERGDPVLNKQEIEDFIAHIKEKEINVPDEQIESLKERLIQRFT